MNRSRSRQTRNQGARRPAVSVPIEKQGWWQFLLAALESLIILVLLVAIAIALYFLYQRLTKEAFFPLKRVVITEPLRYGTALPVSRAVAESGDSDLLHVDVHRVATQLGAIPWVRRASVEKHWPDSLYIHIEERYPIVRWGEHDYLDKDGRRFSLPNPPREDLFQVSGPDGSEKRVLKRYREIEPWLLGQRIDAVAIRLDPRLVWHIRLRSGIDVILGRHDLNQRLKKLAVVYRRVINDYRPYITSVDLRYQDGFSVRWKPGVHPQSTAQYDGITPYPTAAHYATIRRSPRRTSAQNSGLDLYWCAASSETEETDQHG